MSKPFKPGAKSVAVRPSRIRRDPVRVPTEAELKQAEVDKREREKWRAFGGVIFFAAGIAALAVGISVATYSRYDPAAAAAEAARFRQCYNGANGNCVLDGDTLRVGGQWLEIAGLDAPEIQGAACGEERTRGISAAVRLAGLLNGGEVTVGDPFRDQYGRAVRKVEVDGKDVAKAMIAGLFIAAAVLAQAQAAAAPVAGSAPAYGPAEPGPPKTTASAGPARKACSPTTPDPDSDTIVVCVVKPDGYRIDPDILAAKKAKRDADQGKARPPENYADNTCATVGPNGCAFAPAINLLAAAMTAAEIADRVSKGQEIGSVFRTDPQLTEYQYYQLAKAERERKESEAADKTYAAQVEAEAKAAPQR